MSIRKEIKQYGNRRQINITKGEFEGIEEVLILDKSDELQHENLIQQITTLTNTVSERDATIDKLMKENEKKQNQINKLSASLSNLTNRYNNLRNAINNISWTDAILNRHKKILNNYSEITYTESIEAIDTNTIIDSEPTSNDDNKN